MNDLRLHKLKEFLRLRLKEPLPGKKAQVEMSRPERENSLDPPDAVRAGVLLILIENGLLIPLMQRPGNSGPHSGQISFPGGREEPEDKDLAETALRETEEEFGLRPQKLELLGALTPLYIPVSGFRVYPFVAWHQEEPLYNPDPSEVEQIISFPLNKLLQPETLRTETIDVFYKGKTIPYETPVFRTEGHRIWGATAMMLNEFLTLIKEVPQARF